MNIMNEWLEAKNNYKNQQYFNYIFNFIDSMFLHSKIKH